MSVMVSELTEKHFLQVVCRIIKALQHHRGPDVGGSMGPFTEYFYNTKKSFRLDAFLTNSLKIG